MGAHCASAWPPCSLGLVVTTLALPSPRLGRDPISAHSEASGHDTKTMSRRPKLPPMSRHQFRSPNRPLSRHQCHVATPLGCPFHDMKNHGSTKDQLGPSLSHVVTKKLMSQPRGQGTLSRMHQGSVTRAATLSCALLRSAARSCAHT